jgi:hypothetical protein
MFYIKLRLKNEADSPLLIDILDALQQGFNYILNNLRRFYNPNDHNIAYLTFFQEPMINGLNTGPFDIHEGSSEMVQRLLAILNQFLMSNQSLKVNETLKIYVKILSVEHLKYKTTQKSKKNPKKRFGRKFYGSNNNINHKYKWAINVPDGDEFFVDIFKNKCLLTCTLLGISQNNYFKSKRKNKEFSYLQNLNSSYKHKRKHAFKILIDLLNDMISKTDLPVEGPYDLQSTVIKLNEIYNCQFFVFDSIHNSTKLSFMYPEKYDDSLMPIYLYQPLETCSHILFIKNLKSYFKDNLKVCFHCKRTFKSYLYRHLCNKTKVCFSCRRSFMSSKTYIHENLKDLFCDKDIAQNEPFVCSKCNVTLYSSHCEKGHKFFCYGKNGSFGWKCLQCNKFTYRFGQSNCSNIKENHKCGVKFCKYCHEKYIADEHDHVCKIRQELYPNSFPFLAFIGMEHSNSSTGKCYDCFQIKLNYKTKNNLTWKDLYAHSDFINLACNIHLHTQINEPNIIILFKEKKERGHFDKYVLNDLGSEIEDCFDSNSFSYNYVDQCNFKFNDKKAKRKPKTSEDFEINYKRLQAENSKQISLIHKLIQLITRPEWRNTTFISQDEDSLNYVRQFKSFCYFLYLL